MTTKEIIEFITSQDSHKVWEAACRIINMGQDYDKIAPLIAHLPLIKAKTEGLHKGGGLVSKQHFIDFAIKTIEFHESSHECPCALYVKEYQLNNDVVTRMHQYDGFDPNREIEKGNVKILNTTLIQNNQGYSYLVECTKCEEKYQVEELEYHFQWWHWKRVIKNA